MELVHERGWRVIPLAGADGAVCLRLSHGRAWLGDFDLATLRLQLAAHDIPVDGFVGGVALRCTMVDCSTRLICLSQPAEWVAVPGGGLPLCRQCTTAVAQLRAFPAPTWGGSAVEAARPTPGAGGGAAAASTMIEALLAGLGTDTTRQRLSSRLREPLARILGYAELLDEDQHRLGDDQARHARIIHAAARDVQQVLAEIAHAI